MSCRVLVITEDPTYDEAILKPLMLRMLAECGRTNARVLVRPRKARGFEHVTASIPDIVFEYSHFDLMICIVDADGHDRSDRFRQITRQAAELGNTLLCCAAVQEIEAWLLAGHTGKLPAPWHEVRQEINVKERFFNAFLQEHGDPRRPSGGRGVLMEETLRNYKALLQRCPELAELQRAIADALRD